jgi:hypothetical protein
MNESQYIALEKSCWTNCTQIKCSLLYSTSVKPFMSQKTMQMDYYAYFHSIMNWGFNILGDSSYSADIFIYNRILLVLLQDAEV